MKFREGGEFRIMEGEKEWWSVYFSVTVVDFLKQKLKAGEDVDGLICIYVELRNDSCIAFGGCPPCCEFPLTGTYQGQS